MNERIEHCLYQAGLTAQGCWDELDDYAREGIEKFALLIVQECVTAITDDDLAKDCGTFMMDSYAKGMRYSAHIIKEHFGVEE